MLKFISLKISFIQIDPYRMWVEGPICLLQKEDLFINFHCKQFKTTVLIMINHFYLLLKAISLECLSEKAVGLDEDTIFLFKAMLYFFLNVVLV